jgi:dipeptidyl aminopeptidase/acylaminoacyl peptidase
MQGRAIRLVAVAAVAAAAGLTGVQTAAAAGPARIAYMSDRGNAGDIYVVALDGSAPQRLTATGVRENGPAFSPDGRTIAYTREGELWLMDANGANQRPLTGQYSARPTWSPDGGTIVFSGSRAGGAGTGLYAIAVDGTGLRRLTSVEDSRPATMPAYSPDGSTIVFQRSIYLALIDSDGTDERIISANIPGVIPAWSPDGQRIAFSMNVMGASSVLHTARPDGTDVRRMPDSVSRDIAPSWSPDGRQFAFGSERDGNGEIYVMNSDGSGSATRITHDPDGYGPYDGGPSWDPTSGTPLPPSKGAPQSDSGSGGPVRLTVRSRPRQRLRTRGLVIVVRADPGARIAARGALRLPGGRVLRLLPARRVAVARRTTVRLRLRPRQHARARAALRRASRPAVARIRVAVHRAGQPSRAVGRRILVESPG